MASRTFIIVLVVIVLIAIVIIFVAIAYRNSQFRCSKDSDCPLVDICNTNTGICQPSSCSIQNTPCPQIQATNGQSVGGWCVHGVCRECFSNQDCQAICGVNSGSTCNTTTGVCSVVTVNGSRCPPNQ